MLENATREDIQNRLIDEIADLEERIAALEQATQPISPDKAIGRLSRLESMNEKSVNEATLRTAQDRLNKLEIAMTRVYDRDFGICTGCQQPIPVERLLLLPESTRCVKCAV